MKNLPWDCEKGNETVTHGETMIVERSTAGLCYFNNCILFTLSISSDNYGGKKIKKSKK